MVGIRFWKTVVLTVSAIMVSVTAGARDWYVAPGGVDGGAGTTSEPLATLSHAVSRASVGDSISGNVIVDNRRAALGLYIDANPNQGHLITGNVLVSTEPTRRIDRPENLSHWWLPPYAEPIPVALEYDAPADYGSMSHTTFVTPAALAGVIRKKPADTLFSTLGDDSLIFSDGFESGDFSAWVVTGQ